MYLFFLVVFFFFNDTATTEIYTLSLHDALPISRLPAAASLHHRPRRPTPDRPPARAAVTGRPARRGNSSVSGRLSTAPADGRTQHRLAHQRKPESALPRRAQEQPLAAPPHRSIEPASPDHPRTAPPGRPVGDCHLNDNPAPP